jgi:hypothetical protein
MADYWQARKTSRRARLRPVRPDKTCAYCGRTFPWKRGGYCTSEHAQKAKDERRSMDFAARRHRLWKTQGGLCAMCREPLNLENAVVDHDHDCCAKAARKACGHCDRGVLHGLCNTVLGMAADDLALLDAAGQRLDIIGGSLAKRILELAGEAGEAGAPAIPAHEGRGSCKCAQHRGDEPWHGSVTGHQYHGCRCIPCTEGKRAYHRYAGQVRRHGPDLPVDLPIPRERGDKTCALPGCEVTFCGPSKYHSGECRQAALQEQMRESHRKHREDGILRRRRLLWEAQGGLCALCGQPLALEEATLDHDHGCCDTPAKISCGECDRSVMHRNCNTLWAHAGENPLRFSQAIEYLQAWRTKTEDRNS